MKRMLFNATHSEELRVATVDGQKLIDIDIESAGRENRKSNIYKGVITRIEPGLEACFVNYGEERHGFLPFKEISRQYFKQGVDAGRARIQDALVEGQSLLVQIDKEERGNKGAALTTFVSLAGRYLVLMPNNPRGGGVSRRVEGEDRQELRETMDKLEVPSGMSLIARTAGIGRSAEELTWDMNYLMQLWTAIAGAKDGEGAYLIYQESSLVIRAIRDYFTADVGEILIDTDDIYEQARQFMGHVMPANLSKVKRYRDDTPLFSRFQIEHQIETAHSRLVSLPSGGAIVIDHTEALVAIDVNSARSTKGADIEETALRTNLEAADEVARQMRLRDLGGLIVIDFIDMENTKNQREVETRIKDALHYDRARVQTGKISKFGLLEMSRQRLRPALNEGSHLPCPRCGGTGVIRDIESSALHVLRQLQDEAMKEHSAAVYCQVPVDVATYLLNEKRAEITKLEARLNIEIVLIPNRHIETPHYKLERLKHDDERLGTYRATYTMADAPAEDDSYLARKLEPEAPRQTAVVKGIALGEPAPLPAPMPMPVSVAHPIAAPVVAAAAPVASEGIIGRFFGFFKAKASSPANLSAEPAQTVEASAVKSARGSSAGASRDGNRDSNREGSRDSRGRRDRGDRNDKDRTAKRSGTGSGAERTERTERTDRPARPERDRNDTKRGDKGEAKAVELKADVNSGAVIEPRQQETRPTRSERTPREDRKPREERKPRDASADRQSKIASPETDNINVANLVVETQSLIPGIADASGEPIEKGERSRSRNRRRRGRGERSDRPAGAEDQNAGEVQGTEADAGTESTAQLAAQSAPPIAVAVAAAAGVGAAIVSSTASGAGTATERAPAFEAHVSQAPIFDAPVFDAPVFDAPTATLATPVVAVLKPDVIVAAQAPAPVIAVAAPAPTKDLNEVIAGAGLQWVQTVEPAQAYVPKPAALRVARVRKAKPVVDSTPMSQIETGGNKE